MQACQSEKRHIDVRPRRVYGERMQTLEELQQALSTAQTTIAQQAEQLARLQARLTELEQQLLEAQRRSRRQATPFSKDTPKAQPKKPGPKAGHAAEIGRAHV